MLEDWTDKHEQNEPQYLSFISYGSDQFGRIQETPAYISMLGSTLQNTSHFLIQNNEKIGKNMKYPPLFTCAFREKVIHYVHFQ